MRHSCKIVSKFEYARRLRRTYNLELKHFNAMGAHWVILHYPSENATTTPFFESIAQNWNFSTIQQRKKGKRRRSRRQQKSTRQIKMTKQSEYISHCLFGISNSTYGCVNEIWMCTVMDSFICILRLLTSWCCCCCCFFSTLVNFFLHFYTLFYGVLIVFLRFVYNRCYRLTHTRTQSAWAYRLIFFFHFTTEKLLCVAWV